MSAVHDGHVTTEIADGIGTISFFHPKGNSLPAALLAGLAEAVNALGANPAVRVLVLRSEGEGAFCGGASFHEMQLVRTPEDGERFFMGFARLILAMTRCPKFVITRIQGRVVGGGIGVTAASDYAIAVPAASIKLSELAVGIGPFVVGPVIERKIGLAAFTALGVNATVWQDATWARTHGLFAEVRDTQAEADAAVGTLARQLAASNPDAMAQMKQVFWQGTEHWETLLPERARMSGRLVLSEFTQRTINKA